MESICALRPTPNAYLFYQILNKFYQKITKKNQKSSKKQKKLETNPAPARPRNCCAELKKKFFDFFKNVHEVFKELITILNLLVLKLRNLSVKWGGIYIHLLIRLVHDIGELLTLLARSVSDAREFSLGKIF